MLQLNGRIIYPLISKHLHLSRPLLRSEILERRKWMIVALALGLAVLIGFTLAIPSLETASHHPTPLLYIIGSYFPNYVVDLALGLVTIAIFACVLANLTTLTRLVWAMARINLSPWM